MKYRYRTDEELKDSGIEWIGKIPKDWEVKRNKNIFSIDRNLVGDEADEYKVLSLTLRGVIERNLESNIGKIPVSFSTYQIVKPNSILLCLFDMDVTPRICGYINKEGIVTSAYTNINSHKRVFNKYFYYWFLRMDFEKILLSQSKSLRNTLTNDNFMNINIVHPLYEEQKKIANFLDEKTSQFDSIISKKEELIKKLEEAKKSLISEVVTGKVKAVKTDDGYELVKRSSYEMKDSGVEWLGEIPKDWEVKRIKQISSVISKGTTPSTIGKEIIDNGKIRYLKAENIYDGYISLTPKFFIDEETNHILKRSELKENDILFVIAGATIGKNAIVKKEHCPANTNQAISFIRLYSNINHKFVYYWLNSPKLQENMWLHAVQSAQPNLSMESLGNFHITYPNEHEIDILIKYIEIKVRKIIKIIESIKVQIEKLKEAKQSLISEAVTGKIEILD